MSKLLGPLSVTKSNVSWRDCAFAGENTAGADTMAPASAAVDLRKSRRFMEASGCFLQRSGATLSRDMPESERRPLILGKPLIPMPLSGTAKSVAAVRRGGSLGIARVLLKS